MGPVAAVVGHVVEHILPQDRLLVVEPQGLCVGVPSPLVVRPPPWPPAAVHDQQQDQNKDDASHPAADVGQVLDDVKGGSGGELDGCVVGSDLVVHPATVLAKVGLRGPADPEDALDGVLLYVPAHQILAPFHQYSS